MGNFLSDAWDGVQHAVSDFTDNIVKYPGTIFMPDVLFANNLTGELATRGWHSVEQNFIPKIDDPRKDREVLTNSALAPMRIVYGNTRVGGVLRYAESSGAQNQNLNLIIVFAGHAIKGYTEIWFDDRIGAYVDYATQAVTIAPDYVGYAAVEVHDGTQTAASALMLSESAGAWTADHKLLGCAYAAITLVYNETKFPSGIPSIKANIFGKKVYDPRTTLTAWSDNPALCIRDYMLMSPEEGGMGCESAEVDDAYVITAANICDETIQADDWRKRYSMNGYITLSETPASILRTMTSAMAGDAVYFDGKWQIYAGAAMGSAVATLDESWLNGGVSFSMNGKNNRINTVKTKFVDPSNYWADTEAPTVSVGAYITEDGEELSNSITFPFCAFSGLSQRLANIVIQQSRNTVTVSYPCNMKAAKLKCRDLVAVNNSQLGWSGKLFVVGSWKFSEMGGISLTLLEYNSSVWSDPASYSTRIPASATNLPDVWTVAAPTGFTVTEVLYTTVAVAITKSRLDLAWVSAQASGTMYDIAQDGVIIASVPETSYTINDIAPGTYTIAVRAKNGLGAASPWNSITKVVTGQGVEPAAVSGFSATFAGDLVKLIWTGNTETDLSHYEIRTGASWVAGTTIQIITANAYSFRPIASGTTTYWISAVDTAGNVGTAVSASATVPSADVPTAITTTGKFLGIDLLITYVTTRLDTAWVEIWAASANDRNTAVQVGITHDGRWAHEGLNNGVSRYYWARAVTVFGETGAWYPSGATSGVIGSTINDPTLAIQLLNPDVSDSDVASYLSSDTSLLSLLDTRSMLFELGVVGAGVTATYTDALSQAASQMNANQTLLQYLNGIVAGLTVTDYSNSTAYTTGQIVTYSGQTYQCILNSTGNLPTNATYWTPISGLYEMVNTIQQNLDVASGSWSSTAATLTADVADLANPTDGRVTLAESTISQHGNDITLQGTAITGPLALVVGAVTEPGCVVESVEDIPGLDITISRTKIELDVASNAILLQAAEVNSLTGRTSAAEIAIDGHAAAIALRATSADLSGQVDILSDMIGLKLNSSGTVGPGMAIGWTDGTHTKSIIRFNTDTFQIGKTDSSDYRSVFTVGSINGASTVGISGDLLVDGAVSARHITAGSLTVGTNVGLGTAVDETGVVAIVDGTVTADYVNALGITAIDISATTLTGKTIQTASTGRRIVIYDNDYADNNLAGEMHIYANLGRGVEDVAGLGIYTGTDNFIAIFGVADYGTATAVLGQTYAGTGLWGWSNTGNGVKAESITGYGINAEGGKAPMRLLPSNSINVPTHSADCGALWVTSNGILYICTGSNNWSKVGAQ